MATTIKMATAIKMAAATKMAAGRKGCGVGVSAGGNMAADFLLCWSQDGHRIWRLMEVRWPPGSRWLLE